MRLPGTEVALSLAVYVSLRLLRSLRSPGDLSIGAQLLLPRKAGGLANYFCACPPLPHVRSRTTQDIREISPPGAVVYNTPDTLRQAWRADVDMGKDNLLPGKERDGATKKNEHSVSPPSVSPVYS